MPAATMARAGRAASCHMASEVRFHTSTARVLRPKGRSKSVAGISFITSTNTRMRAVSRPRRMSGRCTRLSTPLTLAPRERAASS